MFACCRSEASLASRTNARTNASSSARWGRSRFSATTRSKPSMPRSTARCTVAMPPMPRRSLTSNGPYTSLLADPVKPVACAPGGWRALRISAHGTGQNRNLFRDGLCPARSPAPSHLARPVPVAILVQEAGAGVDDRVAPGTVRVPLAIGFVAALAVARGLGAARAERVVTRAIGLIQALDADAARAVADGSERLV